MTVSSTWLLCLQGRCERGHRVDGEVCGEKHSPAAATEGHHLGCGSLYVATFRPEDTVLPTARTFFGFWPCELEVNRIEWGRPPAVVEDALSPRKRFVTSQTVQSSPWLLVHLKTSTAVARTREVLRYVNKMLSFPAFSSWFHSTLRDGERPLKSWISYPAHFIEALKDLHRRLFVSNNPICLNLLVIR